MSLLVLVLGTACSTPDEPDLSLPSNTTRSGDEADGADEGAAGEGDVDEGDADDPLAGETYHVAQAVDAELVVRTSAQEGANELVTLSADDQLSGKVICLVEQQVGNWVEVHLPSGPDGRKGWVDRDHVALSRHRFRIEVSRAEHELTLYIGQVVALTTPVALGPDAPAEGEERFIKELVQQPPATGTYRTYAYGLSGSDHDRDDFTAGSGVVAIHGAADPAALGGDVPTGAVGIAGDVLTRLVDTIGLPLGTPVEFVE